MIKTLKTLIRLLGISSLSLILFVIFTDWQFNNSWLPVLLINVLSISILLEIFFIAKSRDRRIVIGLFLLVLEGFIFYFSYQVGPVINRHFLSFRIVVYENEDLIIETSKAKFKGRHDDSKAAYYLLDYGLGKSLVKEVEKTYRSIRPPECEIRFIKHKVFYDVCVEKFYP